MTNVCMVMLYKRYSSSMFEGGGGGGGVGGVLFSPFCLHRKL